MIWVVIWVKEENQFSAPLSIHLIKKHCACEHYFTIEMLGWIDIVVRCWQFFRFSTIFTFIRHWKNLRRNCCDSWKTLYILFLLRWWNCRQLFKFPRNKEKNYKKNECSFQHFLWLLLVDYSLDISTAS